DRPLERLDAHVRAERRLDDVQVDRGEDVVAFTDEPRIGPHANADVGVAGPTPGTARVALAADTDLLAVVDTGGDRHLEPPLLDPARGSVAVGARRGHEPAGPAAARARLRPDELAEHAPRDLLQAPG